MIPALILLCALPFVPRSPRWLASQDRWDEAIEVLANVHAHGNQQDPLIIAEVREIREKIASVQIQSCMLPFSNILMNWL